MKSSIVFTALSLCAPLPLLVADAPSAASPVPNKTTLAKISARSAQEQARRAVFLHLEKQVGAKSDLPNFPSEKLLSWIDGRNASVASDPKTRYARLFEHLLIAQLLLESDDLETRKRGFWIASESANFVAAKLPEDKWLLSRLYEG